MTTLREALQGTSWHRLRAIGRRRGLPIPSDWLKADIVDWLVQALPGLVNQAALADLSEAERCALADLIAAGGRLPLRYLRPRHGGLTVGPLEQLRALGLVFHDRATDDVFIPDDILPRLPPLAQPAPPTVAPPWGANEPALLAAHDLACLHRPGTGLALLQAERVFRVDRIRSVVKVRVGSRQ